MARHVIGALVEFASAARPFVEAFAPAEAARKLGLVVEVAERAETARLVEAGRDVVLSFDALLEGLRR